MFKNNKSISKSFYTLNVTKFYDIMEKIIVFLPKITFITMLNSKIDFFYNKII